MTTRLAALRLTIHDRSAQVMPTARGIPWLGFVVFPDHRKAEGAQGAPRHPAPAAARYDAYWDGDISFAEFDASVQGWINHVRNADSWGLRRHMLSPLRLKTGDMQRAGSITLRDGRA